MLSTGYPQDIPALIAFGTGLVSLFAILLSIYVAWKQSKLAATKPDVNRLRAEVSEQSGELSDLRDRFSRFQKREGLRVAREEKKSQADLIAEAQALQAQAQGDIENKSVSSKRDLYKRAFRN
jgi:hypothetical protein